MMISDDTALEERIWRLIPKSVRRAGGKSLTTKVVLNLCDKYLPH